MKPQEQAMLLEVFDLIDEEIAYFELNGETVPGRLMIARDTLAAILGTYGMKLRGYTTASLK